MSSFLRVSNILCGCLLCLLIWRVFALKAVYDNILRPSPIDHSEEGVPYTVHPGKVTGTATLYVGDLLGTNPVSAQHTRRLQPDRRKTSILLPSLHPVTLGPLTPESFLDAISTPQGIVLADNFCFPGWEDVKQRPLYRNTSLSPGPYCLSEPQTRLVDRLIKEYRVDHVTIFADTPGYIPLIKTFLLYLKDKGIAYDIVDNPRS